MIEFLKEHALKNLKLEDTEYPPQIVFETTAYCNLYCSICSHKFMKRPKGEMDPKLFYKVVDEITTYDTDVEIWFAVHGEALLIGPERLVNFINYVKESEKRAINNRKRRAFLNTNGVLLTDEMIDALLTTELDGIIVGIDGFSKETYEQFRNGADYEVVKNNTLNLLKKVKSKQGHKPKVEIQFVVMPENQHELEDFKAFWLEQGASLKIRNKLSWGGAIDSPLLDATKQNRIPCVWTLRNLHILWNGDVPMCGGDIDGIYKVGNVNEQSLLSLWQGPMRERRLKHINRQFEELPDICQNCKDWMVGGSYKIENK